jgi:hypothetical protein
MPGLVGPVGPIHAVLAVIVVFKIDAVNGGNPAIIGSKFGLFNLREPLVKISKKPPFIELIGDTELLSECFKVAVKVRFRAA